ERFEIPHPTRPGATAWLHTVRHLERWPLGTSYTKIVSDVTRLCSTPALHGSPLVIDRTGVGRAVTDMFDQAPISGRIVGVTITSGHDASEDDDGYGWHVPKKDLVAALSALLHGSRLQIAPALREAETLRAELSNFKAKITPAGNETYAAWRENQH